MTRRVDVRVRRLGRRSVVEGSVLGSREDGYPSAAVVVDYLPGGHRAALRLLARVLLEVLVEVRRREADS